MPPTLALSLWSVFLIALLRFDPARDSRLSVVLWVPLAWMFILASRNPGEWFSGHLELSAQTMEKGSPLDRAVFSLLIVAAVGILVSRSFRWNIFFLRNLALMGWLGYALLSVCWSDFPMIAFRRWFRDLGQYLMVLVILSDPRPADAVRTVLRRLGYLLVPLSIVLNKYYPVLGRQYDPWSGIGYYVGATTSKNMLGLLCLVTGLFFFWDTVNRWPERKQRRTKSIVVINVALFSTTVWLLHTARSTTSSVCLVLGCLVIWAGHTKIFRRHHALFKGLVPASFCLYLILDFVFGMNGSMAHAVGKDPTLTDRTKIWAFLLNMHTNPLIGTGYQSFWLGGRLEHFWRAAGLGHLNEAHNGYLEVYLELGVIGIFFLVVFLIASYRAVCGKAGPPSSFAVFGLATWISLVFYSMSEAGFETGILYMVYLLGAVVVPRRVYKRAQIAVASAGTESREAEPRLVSAT